MGRTMDGEWDHAKDTKRILEVKPKTWEAQNYENIEM